MNASGKRAVITGIGAVSALGVSVTEVWRQLLLGETGVRPISRFAADRFVSSLAAEVDDARVVLGEGPFDFEMRRMALFVRFAVAAGEAALADAKLCINDGSASGAMHVGVSMGGLPNIEAGIMRQESKGPRKTTPFLIMSLIPSMAASMLAQRAGFEGRQLTFAGACAAGSQALGAALEAIRRGEHSWILAGGAEAVTTPITFSGFEAMRLLSRGGDPALAPRPFDRGRDGFVIGEGAALFVVEELERAGARGATIYGEISGTATSTGVDGLLLQAPESIAACIRAAIQDAGLEPDDIDAVYAQGSGLVRGDRAEVEALRAVFGRRMPPVTSIKAQTGYTFAANGPLSMLAALMALQTKTLSPTRNFENADDELGALDIVTAPRAFAGRHCLVNAIGFGGVNATLVVSSLPETRSGLIGTQQGAT
ncbi:beta-ketoacyl-[acyl-carrier-protein] synthase family protein [Bradyrhizobium sp.]|uniref:beta-ketoacyl-[acyl-carrier-protein] synthase family protein n=1 Tax=Bradyrhizobium sp. TaxID=376 RepID=UPI002E066CEA|nr:beta-ketoacyl-[acyl-carrier-protein] synthase family protein [Bradyrhizobium sp.]